MPSSTASMSLASCRSLFFYETSDVYKIQLSCNQLTSATFGCVVSAGPELGRHMQELLPVVSIVCRCLLHRFIFIGFTHVNVYDPG